MARTLVHSVVPMKGMNCASARYVVNKWLKRGYERQSYNRIPTHFFDGYVTWHCRRTSGYGWRCDEYTSNTAFASAPSTTANTLQPAA